MQSDYPYADTKAAKLLHAALKKASAEGTSLREVGRQLGYKQPVAISHMSLGRVPIPLDRAGTLADAVGIDKAQFLRATAEQRHPDVDWSLIADVNDTFAHELSALSGSRLDDLPADTKRVLREVVVDAAPDRRWLTPVEIRAVEQVRSAVPHFRTDGLQPKQLARIIRTLDDA